jgi:phage-related protein (TIGR01555 family)
MRKTKQDKKIELIEKQLDNMSDIATRLMEESEKNNLFGEVKGYSFNQTKLDYIYEHDPIARKVCNKPISDMLKNGIDINDEKQEQYVELWEQYKITEILKQFGSYNNAFGGSAIVYEFNGNSNESSIPINETQIKELSDIFVVDRFFLNPIAYKSMKKTELFRISNLNTNIHRSRLSLAFGIDTGIRNLDKKQGWGKSRIELLYGGINNYHIAHNALPTIITNFHQTVIQLKDFMNTVGTPQELNINKRMAYLHKFRSYLNAIVLDKEDGFANNSINLSNLDKVIYLIEKALCTMAEMPHTKLLEEGSGNTLSNTKDNSQTDQYNDWLEEGRQILLSPPINKILLIFSKMLKQTKPPKWEYKPLERMKENEMIKLRQDQAKTDEIYDNIARNNNLNIGKKLLVNRFGSGYYSYETEMTESDLIEIPNNNSKEPVKTA